MITKLEWTLSSVQQNIGIANTLQKTTDYIAKQSIRLYMMYKAFKKFISTIDK